jgi:hypothetical protein
MTRSRSRGVSACESAASASATPSSRSTRYQELGARQTVEPVVALERMVEAQAVGEPGTGVKFIGEVPDQLQQSSRPIQEDALFACLTNCVACHGIRGPNSATCNCATERFQLAARSVVGQTVELRR